MAEKLYKVLAIDGSCCNGGQGKWFLPKGKRPGKWMPEIKGDLDPCVNGYHLCRLRDLLYWVDETIFEAEYRGERVNDANKVVVRQARLLRKCEGWNEVTARLFACDCAERVLPMFEKQRPSDDRPRKAIETARRYANGEATGDELAAARAAAGAAAWAAGATRAAEHKWQTRRLSYYLRKEARDES